MCSVLGVSQVFRQVVYRESKVLYLMFSCVLVTFPYGILGQVWYMIVSIPDLCHSSQLYKIFRQEVFSVKSH